MLSTAVDPTTATETSPLLAKDEEMGHGQRPTPSNNNDDDAKQLFVLVDLVGACHLPIQNMDTYCVVQYGTKTIHKTQPMVNYLSNATRLSRALWRLSSQRAERLYQQGLQNPIWTVQEHALLTVPVTKRDVANSRALIINVWARPKRKLKNRAVVVANASAPKFVGKCHIKVPDILQNHLNEQRLELPLEGELGNPIMGPQGGGEERSTLALRCRVASQADVAFCRHWNHQRDNGGADKIDPTRLLMEGDILHDPDYIRGAMVTEKENREILGKRITTALTSSMVSSPPRRGLIRVKPYADPHQPEETEFMTHSDIKSATGRPSQKWIQAGSEGSTSLGRLYVEILSAHDLPNVDFGSTVGNETDSFCTLVYGDAMVQTDVIDDELNPHWLPWSQRAFVFHMQHPSQVLYLAVFGFKRNPLVNHTPIGRVEINPINLQNNTIYNLEYHLTSTSHSTERFARGRIKIRLRMEVDDERRALLATMFKPPPVVYVNVTKKKSLQVARYTCCGEYNNEEKFSVQVLQGYIAEILDGYLKTIIESLQHGGASLIFWRNQVTIGAVGFPLYSLLAFIVGISVVENPEFLPASLFFGLAGLFLVYMQLRQNSPSPWKRSHSFGHYFRILIMGKSIPEYTTISANAAEGEIKAMQAELERQTEEAKRFDEKREMVEKDLEELEGLGNIQTKSNGIPLELLVVLGKIQGIVGGMFGHLRRLDVHSILSSHQRVVLFPYSIDICRFLRAVEIIVTWEESSLAFLITFFLLLAGMISLFLPWAFLLKLMGRVLVIALLGPQNKLIDLFWSRQQKESDDQRIRKMFRERFREARCKQEEARKLKAFRQLLFGKYSTFVPSMMWTPHQDFPLPSSSARFEENIDVRSDQSTNFPFVVGQQLFGRMIPRPEQAWLRNAGESTVLKKAVTLLQTEVDTSEEVNNMDVMSREASLVLDEGFEVVDMFDEEAGFIREVSKPPPREESLRELGIEIQQGETQSMRFTPAWKSVEALPDSDMSSRNSNESFSHIEAIGTTDILPENDRRQLVAREQSTFELGVEILAQHSDEAKMSWREIDLENPIPEPICDELSPATSEQSTIELGVEIMEQFSTEMEYTKQSFRGDDNPHKPSPQQAKSVVINVKDQGDAIEVEPSFSLKSPAMSLSGSQSEVKVSPGRNNAYQGTGRRYQHPKEWW
eukprot:scaffold5139_cov155-Amphora_coffeaeformis.AAC.3